MSQERKGIGKTFCKKCNKLQSYDVVINYSTIMHYCRIRNSKIREFLG